MGLLDKLSEACSDQHLVPTSIRILDFYEDNMAIVYDGGHSRVLKGGYKGREVAVKVVRTHTKGNLSLILGVREFFVPEHPRLRRLV